MQESIVLYPRETVILAEDFKAMINWYQTVLGFQVTKLFEDDFHFCNLQTPSGIKIGIGDAKEMGVEPKDRSKNTVILQFEVDTITDFFNHLEQHACKTIFGPSHSEKDDFWYGAFEDLEGNPCWVVDKNCP